MLETSYIFNLLIPPLRQQYFPGSSFDRYWIVLYLLMFGLELWSLFGFILCQFPLCGNNIFLGVLLTDIGLFYI